MIDHTGVIVSDFTRSKEFYRRALEPIGYRLLAEFPAALTGSTDVAGFGVPPKPDFWIGNGRPNVPPIHIAFRVENRALVQAFYQAALSRALLRCFRSRSRRTQHRGGLSRSCALKGRAGLHVKLIHGN